MQVGANNFARQAAARPQGPQQRPQSGGGDGKAGEASQDKQSQKQGEDDKKTQLLGKIFESQQRQATGPRSTLDENKKSGGGGGGGSQLNVMA